MKTPGEPVLNDLRNVWGLADGGVVADRYRIGRRPLGPGRANRVLSAFDIQLDRRVAIQFFHPRGFGNARLIRGLPLAKRLTSEHVLRVFDDGVLLDGTVFVVTEFLVGCDLATWASRSPLAVDQAVDVVVQACDAVVEMHGVGIVHRDIKPERLFAAEGPSGVCIKVLDFRHARDRDARAAERSGTASVEIDDSKPGRLFFMAPEHIRGSRDVDKRADIWSLGVTLAALLMGKTPFEGSAMQIFLAHTGERPLKLSACCPPLDDDLASILGKCTQHDREQRFQNVAELVRVLARFAPERSKGLVESILDRVPR